MNDPHVLELRYRLVTAKDVSYTPGLVVAWSTTEFDGELNDGLLTLRMKTHHPTVGSAQEAVREFLKTWEIKVALEQGPGYLGFDFDSSEVIDRNPPPPGSRKVLDAEAGMFMSISGTAEGNFIKGQYPDAPQGFTASPLVQTLWQRYRAFLDGKELLTGMGYFCLSVLQADAGGRNRSAIKYAVEIDVLDTLGRLTSEVGDENTARKLDQGSTFRPHTNSEKEWITAAVKQLILRAGEVAANPAGPHTLIEMSNLPVI